MPYVSEKLKEARYAFSDQEVKQYFTEPKVLDGLFRIIETLFEVEIRPDAAPVWHPSVRFFRIERAGELVGQFYLDPYARAGKRPGAWMDDVRGRWARPDAAGTPADPGGPPGLQLRAPLVRGRQAAPCPADPRRRDHPVP